MSIKRDDLDAGRIDFAGVTTGKRLPLIHPGEILRDDLLRPLKISKRSPDGAQRNPGFSQFNTAAPPDFASLHPGYSLWRTWRAARKDRTSWMLGRDARQAGARNGMRALTRQ